MEMGLWSNEILADPVRKHYHNSFDDRRSIIDVGNGMQKYLQTCLIIAVSNVRNQLARWTFVNINLRTSDSSLGSSSIQQIRN